MGIRETINQNQGITAGVAIGIIVLALGLVFYSQCGGSGVGGAGDFSGKAYYTIDEGKNWFTDEAAKPIPFDKDGQQAVLLHLVTCKDSKEKTVWYLERMTAKAKAEYEKMLASLPKEGGPPPMSLGMDMMEAEIKRPGDTRWFLRGAMGAPTRDMATVDQIMNNKPCPHGGKHPQNEIMETFPKKGE